MGCAPRIEVNEQGIPIGRYEDAKFNYLQVGFSKNDVIGLMGYPELSSNENGMEKWVWDDMDGATHYIVFKNGAVSEWGHTPATHDPLEGLFDTQKPVKVKIVD